MNGQVISFLGVLILRWLVLFPLFLFFYEPNFDFAWFPAPSVPCAASSVKLPGTAHVYFYLPNFFNCNTNFLTLSSHYLHSLTYFEDGIVEELGLLAPSMPFFIFLYHWRVISNISFLLWQWKQMLFQSFSRPGLCPDS